MGPSLTSCNTTVYGFGDNTAGPIWKESLPEDQGLLGSFTSMTNAPFGENLYSPVGFSLILQLVLIKAASLVGGPVCGYNLVNMVGFMLSALVMFAFIYDATRRRWLALLAGYAVAFTPYYQMKVGGHPSYGYQVLFIGLIWLFYRLIMYKKKKDAILLAIIFAIAVYFDPYFSLFSALILGALGFAWALIFRRKIFSMGFWRSKKLTAKDRGVKKQFNLLLLAFVGIVTLLIPLIVILATQGKEVASNVAAARGNVVAEAKACSNWPHEYVVPSVLNPVFERVFGQDRYVTTIDNLRDKFSCGIGEDTIGLSLILVSLCLIGFLVFAWEKLNRRTLKLSSWLRFDPKILIIGMLTLILVAVAIGFPPLKYLGIIPTPSFELLSITPTWRTLTRVYMLVNIATVTLAIIFIGYFYDQLKFKKRPKLTKILYGLIFFVIVVEYQMFMPFSGNRLSTFDYTKDVPPVYSWVAAQKNIGTIAEYPLERSGGESDATSFYLTMQPVHKKRLFNSALSYSQYDVIKSGIKDISDPQSIRVLKSFGVDAVIVHGVDLEEISKIPNIRITYQGGESKFSLARHTPTVKVDTVAVLDLSRVESATTLVELGSGFVRNTTIIKSAANWEYEAIDGSKLLIKEIKDKKVANSTKQNKVCFNVKIANEGVKSDLILKIDNKVVSGGVIEGESMKVEVDAMDIIQINNSKGYNMRVSEIGCREG